MKYDVFISYSRKDYIDENKQIIPGNIISQIKELFDINGITYWFDEDGVFSGDAFAPIIARNIKSSSIFLFISSENSNASEWTSNEIATAHSYKKKIIPFRYDDSVYNDSVILYIARLDYIEYKNNPNKSLARLLSSVQGYLKDESERVEREKAEEERRRNAEISRQERIAKLNSLRERIENLENRKFELDKDILAQEKSLSDLRNEKKIIENNIIELQREEASLLGHRIVYEDKESKTKEKSATKSNIFQKLYSYSFWKLIKTRYFLHFTLILSLFVSIIDFIIAIMDTKRDRYILHYTLCLIIALISIFGLIRLLKGKKEGMVILLLNSILFHLIWYIVSGGILYAYGGVIIYLSVVAAVYILHKKDKESPLSWKNMKCSITQCKLKVGIAVITYIILSFVVPYIYAKSNYMTDYTIQNGEDLLFCRLKGRTKDIANSYMPSCRYKSIRGLKQDYNLALKWYSIANDENGIALCNEYFTAKKEGYYVSSNYGKCGINKNNNHIVKISISNYDGGPLLSNEAYKINIIGVDNEKDGNLIVDGASLNRRGEIYNIKKDTVTLKFVQDDNIIAERHIPVNKVKIENYIRTKYENNIVTVKIKNPTKYARWVKKGSYENEVSILTNTPDSLSFRYKYYYNHYNFDYVIDNEVIKSFSIRPYDFY